MKYRFEVLAKAHESKDSLQVVSALQSISNYYQAFGMLDSAVFYFKKILPWSPLFQRLNYPVGLVGLDRSYADEVRPLQQQVIAELRTRLPANLLPLCDRVQDLFDGLAAADTAKITEAYERLIAASGTSSDTRRELGELYIQWGKYKKGVDWLQPFVSGLEQTSSGYYYPLDNYYLGIASEGLGDTKEAARYYREMLKYWATPEIEIAPIKDAKARLAKLAS